MEYTISSLLEPLTKKYPLTQAVGSGAESRTVEWVYMAEDASLADFLRKNELIITTGIFTKSSVSLYDFILAVMEQSASGLIINTGKYLFEEDITPEIRSLCEEKRFPVYLLSWEVRLTDIMQELCALLVDASQKNKELTDIFFALLNTGKTELNEELLSRAGFGAEDKYRLAVLEKPYAGPVRAGMHTMMYEGNNVLIAVCGEKEDILKNYGGRAGISSRSERTELPMLYREAVNAMRAAEIRGEKTGRYEDIGILSYIFEIKGKVSVQSRAMRLLGAAVEYDKSHGAELVETLFYYLRTGGSPAETARLMYTHRNTISYRINKLRELCGTDFSDAEECFDYLASIYILKAGGIY